MTTRTVSTSAPHVTVNINTAHNKTRTVTNGARKTNAERGKSCISFRVGPELFDEFKATCIDNDISMTKAFEKELRTWLMSTTLVQQRKETPIAPTYKHPLVLSPPALFQVLGYLLCSRRALIRCGTTWKAAR